MLPFPSDVLQFVILLSYILLPLEYTGGGDVQLFSPSKIIALYMKSTNVQ